MVSTATVVARNCLLRSLDQLLDAVLRSLWHGLYDRFHLALLDNYAFCRLSADLSPSFFIAFLTAFLSRALSTALLTDFLTTLLDVFLRTVWSIALSNRFVATFLALLALAIDQSL